MPFFIELGIMIGIIILASAIAKTFIGADDGKGGKGGKVGKLDWHSRRAQDAQRAEALKTYERLAKEKLDVIKTAVAVGYSEGDLERLDARLEKLIGADKLKSLLKDGQAPPVDAELFDADLDLELKRLQKVRSQVKR